jgi:HSP20 family molecular chaperone IbpA
MAPANHADAATSLVGRPGNALDQGPGESESRYALPSMQISPTGLGLMLRQARDMQADMDRAFGRTLSEFNRIAEWTDADAEWNSLLPSPSIDVRESSNVYVLVAEIPEIEAADVSVVLTGRTLNLTAGRQAAIDGSGRARQYTRTFRFPGPVMNDNTATAHMSNGILRVTVPKALGHAPAEKALRLL